MTQAELNRAVAHATGESVSMIKRLGFGLVEPSPDDCDESDQADALDEGPHILDWDNLQAVRLDRALAAA